MKKLLLLFTLSALVFANSNAQYVTIPDTAFRRYLITNYPTCFNAASQLDTTCNILQYTTIIQNKGGYKSTTNLDGIEYFKALKIIRWDSTKLRTISKLPSSLATLELKNDSLINLPSLPNSLMFLDVSNNLLTSISLLPDSLRFLLAAKNQLTTLPSLPNSLTYLNIPFNLITFLSTLPDSLRSLNAGSNRITNFPNMPSKFEVLDISNNLITSLPPFSSTLTKIRIGGNKISSILNLPPALLDFDCGGNLLDSLPLLPNKLSWLQCQGNLLKTLPSLPGSLSLLNCQFNKLTVLPPLPSDLKRLICSGNLSLQYLPPLPDSLQELQIGSDKIICLPVLPQRLTELTLDTSKIKCIPNSTKGLVVRFGLTPLNNFPICSPTNNLQNCQSFPIIQGNVFYDLNINGIKDANEYFTRQGRVNLSNGAFTFTSDSGKYQMAPDTIGTFSLTTNMPPFFNAVPPVSTFHFTTYDTLVTQNIALQPTAAYDSIRVTITSVSLRARAGMPFAYTATYKNAGSTNLPATHIVLHYDSSLLTFVSASNAAVSNSGNYVTLHLSSLPVGDFGEFITNFNVKTSVPAGGTIVTDVSMTSGAFITTDTSHTVITASFDPNDKDATPVLTPEQISNGTYIDYVIRFQNIGNDTAFHVVIADTLNSQLQANTFEVVNTSHPCKITVRSNQATFELRNIMLPYSSVNEPASHGFIRFRVKPVNTLVVGNAVSNKAAIYFDYNTPVITNTAVTQITAQIVPLKLISFKGKKIENGIINLYWCTNNELNTKEFLIEQSTNSREFTVAGKTSALGYGNNNYSSNIVNPAKVNLYFRLKMFDKDGKFTYSSVILVRDHNKAGLVLNKNPVKNEIVLTSIATSLLNTEGVLINNTGAVVKCFTFNSASKTISVNDLSAGVYYLKTAQGNEKVIISR